ncbi:hypothetical protein FXO38_29050 [Capsicum annuum]|nr:hypothetical protein FXO37_33464 [Capsicum annuum]KAF3626803.1 hypothetical protein FXO38_29050 [Capsicum annuum]
MVRKIRFKALYGLKQAPRAWPDIVFSIGVVSRFMPKTSKLHLGVAKRILIYITVTSEHGIRYSKRLSVLAACQAVWLRRLVVDFNQKPFGATEIFCNDRSAIAMTKKPAFHSRTMHIDVRYHYIRSLVSTGEIAMKSCDTNEQAVDIFTKSLPQAKHEFLRGQLGV